MASGVAWDHVESPALMDLLASLEPLALLATLI